MGSKNIPPGPSPEKDQLKDKELKHLQGPQARGTSIVVEVGEKTSEDGEYRCDECGKGNYLEKEIYVPNCPECGGVKFRKEKRP
jgi:DNA-directed RNA polymerase subunit RPC12/RpoP